MENYAFEYRKSVRTNIIFLTISNSKPRNELFLKPEFLYNK